MNGLIRKVLPIHKALKHFMHSAFNLGKKFASLLESGMLFKCGMKSIGEMAVLQLALAWLIYI